MFSNYPGSLLAAICGILSGLAYRSDALRLNKFQFPGFINNFFSRFVLPLLQSPTRGAPRNPIQINPNGTIPARPSQSNNNMPQRAFAEQLIPGNAMPFPVRAPPPPQPPSEDSISALTSMGFSRDAVVMALQRTNNDLQLATNVLLDSVQ